jgi:hypothetical protein
MAPHRIDRDDRAFDHQHVEKLRDSNDLAGFLGDLHLAKYEARARGESGNQLDGAFACFSTGSARGLTIDRHHPCGHADQRGGPGDESTLELLRVEGGEDVAKMIVRRSTVEEWPESPEKFAFLATKPRSRRRDRLRPAPPARVPHRMNT